MDPGWATVGVAFIIAVVGPVILNHLNTRQRSRERKEDHAREDLVAERAAATAEVVKQYTSESKSGLEDMRVVVDQTHTLVNSNMDEEKRRRLEGALLLRAALEELTELKRANGQEPTPATIAALKAVNDNIAELSVEIEGREKRLEVADAQALAAGADPAR